MIWFLLAHLCGAVAAPLLVRWAGRSAFFMLALVPAATFAWLLSIAPGDIAGQPWSWSVPWIPALHMDLALRIDMLAWVILLVVTGVGALVLAYCARYFKPDEQALGAFAGILVSFAGAMVGVVAADDVMLLFIFWELTTIFSYLLIAHRPEQRAARRAAVNALIPTTAGGLAMMVGLLMTADRAGTSSLHGIVDSPMWEHADPYLVTAMLLIVAGAVTKSALIPFHFWLPGAMAAPTPVSAYLHAAAMVKAGIYLILRLGPALAHMPGVITLIAVLGALTMLLGGWRALRQHDIKLLLAYGTVSQLGFLAAISAIAAPAASVAAVALLLAHATFKAPLFMVVGIIDTTFKTRDLRELDRVGRRAPVLAVIAIVSAASMSAIPPLFGFIAKEAVFTALWEGGLWQQILLAVLVAGSAFTVAYSWRFVRGAFGPADGPAGGAPPGSRAARALSAVERRGLRVPVAYWAPAAAITLVALALVPLAAPLQSALDVHGRTLPAGIGPGVDAVHLSAIPPLGMPLLASAIAIALGVVLILAARSVERFQAAVSPRTIAGGRFAAGLDAERVFRQSLRGLDRVAVIVTSMFQRGSLPFALGTIFMVQIALVLLVFIGKGAGPFNLVPWFHPAELLVLAVVLVAAIGTIRSRRRLRAALLATATGYACAFLFVMWGGIDVATTQVLVETILTVVLILVLRRLPARFSRRPIRGDRIRRGVIAIGTAVVLCAVAAAAAAARTSAPLGRLLLDRAYEVGGGKNVVNVILVDARAWDTMGEISVLLVVATGVASLVFVTAREQRIPRVRDAVAGRPVWRRRPSSPLPDGVLRFDVRPEQATGGRWRTWLAAGVTLAPERRLVILEVLARLMFPLMMVFSVYLLFAGHDRPGGGFAGGLVAGLALVLRYLAGGRYELAEALPLQPGLILGIGMVLAVLSGAAPLAVGGEIFQSFVAVVDVPVIGEVHLVSAMAFDIGVYLVVFGVVLDFLRSLGAQLDVQIGQEREKAAAKEREKSAARGDGAPQAGAARADAGSASTGGASAARGEGS